LSSVLVIWSPSRGVFDGDEYAQEIWKCNNYFRNNFDARIITGCTVAPIVPRYRHAYGNLGVIWKLAEYPKRV
jgi:hypothetical protein